MKEISSHKCKVKYTFDDILHRIASLVSFITMVIFIVLLVYSCADATTIEEAVYHEARGESIEGQVAVAFVILNRIDSGLFPNTAKEVIEQTKPSCQFSFFCQGKKDINDQKAFAECQKAVLIAINMKYAGLIDFPALFYKADYSNQEWDRPFLIKIGRHEFYE